MSRDCHNCQRDFCECVKAVLRAARKTPQGRKRESARRKRRREEKKANPGSNWSIYYHPDKKQWLPTKPKRKFKYTEANIRRMSEGLPPL